MKSGSQSTDHYEWIEVVEEMTFMVKGFNDGCLVALVIFFWLNGFLCFFIDLFWKYGFW